MSTAKLISLANPNAILGWECVIYKPLGGVYKILKGDQLDGVLDFTSMPTSRALDTTTTELRAILTTSLPARLIYSRQMVGWRAVVKVNISVFGESQLDTNQTVFEGIITGGSVLGLQSTLEISNQTILLKSTQPVILSNNCPLIFGSEACGVVRGDVEFSIATMSNTPSLRTITPVEQFRPSNQFSTPQWVVVVGDISYKVRSINYNGLNIANFSVEYLPPARPDIAYLVRTCDQTIQQCRNYGNTMNFRGSVLPRNPLSLKN